MFDKLLFLNLSFTLCHRFAFWTFFDLFIEFKCRCICYLSMICYSRMIQPPRLIGRNGWPTGWSRILIRNAISRVQHFQFLFFSNLGVVFTAIGTICIDFRQICTIYVLHRRELSFKVPSAIRLREGKPARVSWEGWWLDARCPLASPVLEITW